MGNRKKISILGSTGSIGVQTLDVIDRSEGLFSIKYLTANENIEKLEEQTINFNPEAVVIADDNSFHAFKEKTCFKGKILCGYDSISDAASDPDNDLVISSLVGFSGVLPTLAALEAGIDVALANKETLVSAGKIITDAADKSGASIIAVDSEHNAILQCLAGEKKSEIEKIILTASGGPFLETPIERFKLLTVSEALNHPNWSMGNKISIDSATMMNKGFEVIEARWLFGMDYDKIEVVIHPQSIIHSMVQFIDGSVKAQLGNPDMRIPISYALNFPNRLKYDFPRLDLTQTGSLAFYKPDFERTPCLKLAFDTLETGGTATAVLNAVNEIAVDSFLREEILFTQIPQCIEYCLNKMTIVQYPSLSDIQDADSEARILALNYVKNIKKR